MTVLREYFPNAGPAGNETTLGTAMTAGTTVMKINTPSAGFGTAPGQLPSDTSVQWRALVGDEILIVPGGTSLTPTVSRAAEGGSAATHANGAAVRAVVTGGALDRILAVYDHGTIMLTCRDIDVVGVGVQVTDVGGKATLSFPRWEPVMLGAELVTLGGDVVMMEIRA